MPSMSEERLKNLWLLALAAVDPDQSEALLLEFRDAVHEYIDQRRAEKRQKGRDSISDVA
jgi:hypothetical protein